ncbi:DNA replication complex GINS protein PSF2 [Exidia glandulosa HHB12029]|uniref:DNA replication complex GINS protein PSF2 n=1 Tax=Exidia glandulosa HHB12029 TaxID=1314781 RepID=A0A165R1A2_EXIGL|nr:DNA replication complex GINS protein PSF2 [Exidia glandulosa HHB12029]
MSLPSSLRASMSPQELEFVAGEEIVEIVPSIRMAPIRLISGVYGPFRPPAKAKVPLWLASNLKLKKKCHIVPPDWLSVEALQERLADETSAEGFSPLPFRWLEISKVVLDIASDDVTNPDRIRSLLKDIREARQSKIREGLRSMGTKAVELEMPNVGSMEINEVRPFFVKAMNVIGILSAPPRDITENQAANGTDFN